MDLVYYGNQRQLEFDFVVTPDADPAAIKLAFTGADKVEINAQGDLVLDVNGGEVHLHTPRIYQEIDGIRHTIDGNYILFGPETHTSGHATETVGFAIAAYDTSKPLIIDPVLSYSTYLGGNDFDVALALAPDGSGGVWVAGETRSTDFPTAGGGSGEPGDVTWDAFVSHFSAAGTLIFSTYDWGGKWL